MLGLLSRASLLASVLAAPRPTRRVGHEKRALRARDRGRRVGPDSILPARMGVKQNKRLRALDGSLPPPPFLQILRQASVPRAKSMTSLRPQRRRPRQ